MTTGNSSDAGEFAVSFEALLDVVGRMIEAGRIRDDGVSVVAGRLWSLTHGAVLLEIAGFFGHDAHGLTQILAPAFSTPLSAWAPAATGSTTRWRRRCRRCPAPCDHRLVSSPSIRRHSRSGLPSARALGSSDAGAFW
ncbi:TetR-like C-terminal domain-containing protein [Mycolicibacterium litorale]|nr:TetR-like C-terminal domain-containing protein [Mycolicibacterium litorale]